ncbi:P27 family predicted phage terminase small subunit [Rhodopseudomonas rhenobacensis]|uniref:P27 family predicted phage terminase small subunit n=1 Tax=Rhodopseudomonas rhenobacensis TaxID=87461 RepID=A0A7W7Z120_9BRAD|nr:phage terminase small subunit P27 family [Rhodopseudomonas rhenobacensis]MBB5045929.1 P27 family predicted phage terminase small subunit [Rhodopseudomonas rhenobacensis]
MRGTKPTLVVDNGTVLRDIKAPSWMSKDAKAEWRRVFPVIRKRRILTVADLGSLENYCVALGTVREMERTLQAEGHVFSAESGPKRHPAVAIQSDAMTRALRLASELGLTPVSRSRPAVRKDDDDEDVSPLDF